jgi:Cu(I)/Ag(I) efflux system periplasmic protein CusF
MRWIVWSATALLGGAAVPASSVGLENLTGVPVFPTEERTGAHRSKGIVEKVDPDGRRITVRHGLVPSLAWPARSVTFDVKEGVPLDAIAAGDDVDFEFTSDKTGRHVIGAINKSPPAPTRLDK